MNLVLTPLTYETKPMAIDDRELGSVLEQSEDLHADSTRHNRVALADLVDIGRDDRAHSTPDDPGCLHEARGPASP